MNLFLSGVKGINIICFFWMWISTSPSIIYWINYLFSDLIFFFCQKSGGNSCVAQFLDPVFCSLGLRVYFCVTITLCLSSWLCGIIWDQVYFGAPALFYACELSVFLFSFSSFFPSLSIMFDCGVQQRFSYHTILRAVNLRTKLIERGGRVKRNREEISLTVNNCGLNSCVCGRRASILCQP